MIEWVFDNKEWLFSGVLVALLGWLFKKYVSSSTIKSGDNSTNTIVSGDVSGDVKIGGKND